MHDVECSIQYSDLKLFIWNSGTNNSSINRRSVNWQKTKRIKARVSKKLSKTKERHVATAVKGVSGNRTRKHQKKVEKRLRRLAASTAAEAMEGMQVDKTVDNKDQPLQEASHPVAMQQ